MADAENVVKRGFYEGVGLNSSCQLCGVGENLLRCSRCHSAYYCSKEHQKQHWKVHKRTCGKENKDTNNTTTSITGEGQSDLGDDEKLSRKSRDGLGSSTRSTDNVETTPMPSKMDTVDVAPTPFVNGKSKPFEATTGAASPHPQPMTFSLLKQKVKMHSLYAEKIIKNSFIMQKMCDQIVADLNMYGICVIDQFLGKELGTEILNEVNVMHSSGVFEDGQLVSNPAKDTTVTIRGDKITWVGGSEENCRHIGDLIGIVDTLIFQCNKQQHNGELAKYEIAGRTKAMVACYPGDGAQYVKHVDNPNQDGRCVTSIYYLNKDWNNRGGILRIFPEGKNTVADIKPIFDRIVFFWSDRRNPHEVQASFQTRCHGRKDIHILEFCLGRYIGLFSFMTNYNQSVMITMSTTTNTVNMLCNRCPLYSIPSLAQSFRTVLESGQAENDFAWVEYCPYLPAKEHLLYNQTREFLLLFKHGGKFDIVWEARYAITLWYFDHKEREKAMSRYHRTKKEK